MHPPDFRRWRRFGVPFGKDSAGGEREEEPECETGNERDSACAEHLILSFVVAMRTVRAHGITSTAREVRERRTSIPAASLG